jgi:hypothetical protein
VSGENVALGHLLLEAALLTNPNSISGRPFVISDPSPPMQIGNYYKALSTLSMTGFKTELLPTLPLYLLSHLVEQYHLLQARLPILPGLPLDIQMLQPGLWGICGIHTIAVDVNARKSVQDGGLGYKGGCTTLEGICMQILRWNQEHEGAKTDKATAGQDIVTEITNVAAVPAAAKF